MPRIPRAQIKFTPALDKTAYDSPYYAGPKSARERLGDLTGASRPAYPRVHRKFGMNTRATVYKLKDTGVLDNKYAKGLTEQRSVAPVISPNAALMQGGTASLCTDLRALQPGAHHWLFEG